MTSLPNAFVLLSGGLDSTTLLYYAADKHNGDIEALGIDYGQRHRKELMHAMDSCKKLGIPYTIVNLAGVVPKTLLKDEERALPNASYADLPTGISPTYVPFRNGLMLAALASVVQGRVMAWEEENKAKSPGEVKLYYGAHAEDSANWAYPDCTPEFNGAMANAIFIGSYQKVRLETPFQWADKWQIVKHGDMLNVPWRDTWSCYAGGDTHCGTCPTCRARKDAFRGAGVFDPTEYAE